MHRESDIEFSYTYGAVVQSVCNVHILDTLVSDDKF